MRIIQQITDNAKQKQTIILDDGSSFSLRLEYKPLQLGWFIVELNYNGFILQNIRIVNSPNFLQQFKNQIPFGLACSVKGGQEPMLQEDFAQNRATLYLLDADEVAEFGDFLGGQETA